MLGAIGLVHWAKAPSIGHSGVGCIAKEFLEKEKTRRSKRR